VVGELVEEPLCEQAHHCARRPAAHRECFREGSLWRQARSSEEAARKAAKVDGGGGGGGSCSVGGSGAEPKLDYSRFCSSERAHVVAAGFSGSSISSELGRRWKAFKLANPHLFGKRS
jgi:hypothetical protein